MSSINLRIEVRLNERQFRRYNFISDSTIQKPNWIIYFIEQKMPEQSGLDRCFRMSDPLSNYSELGLNETDPNATASSNETNSTEVAGGSVNSGPATVESQSIGNVSVYGYPIRNATLTDATITNDVLRDGTISNSTRSVVLSDVSGLAIVQLGAGINRSWDAYEQSDVPSRENRNETVLGFHEYILAEINASDIDVQIDDNTASLRFTSTRAESIYRYLNYDRPGSRTDQPGNESIPVEYQVNVTTYEIERVSMEYTRQVQTPNGTAEAVVTTALSFTEHENTSVEVPEQVQAVEPRGAVQVIINNSTTEATNETLEPQNTHRPPRSSGVISNH
jgi:hypothetical protein